MFKHLLGKHDNLNLNYFSCIFNNCSYFSMNYFYKIKYNSVSKKTEKSIVLKSIYKEYVSFILSDMYSNLYLKLFRF